MNGRAAVGASGRNDENIRVFRLVMEAVRYFGRAEGATPKDVRAYIQTHHRVDATDQELALFVKEVLKMAVCMGVLKTYNRRYMLISNPKVNSQKKVNQIMSQKAGWAPCKMQLKGHSTRDICLLKRHALPGTAVQVAKAKKGVKIPYLEKKPAAAPAVSCSASEARSSSAVPTFLDDFGQPRVVNMCVRSRKPTKYSELRPKKPTS